MDVLSESGGLTADSGGLTATSGLLQTANVYNRTTFLGGVIYLIDNFLTLPQNVSTTAIALNLTASVGALKDSNIAAIVDDTKDITIFLPIDAAFQDVGSIFAKANSSELLDILEYHCIAGDVLYSPELHNSETLTTLGGE